MAPQIPDRWLQYQPIGERIEGTRFIAFKVPLREHINRSVSENNRLHGKLLLEKVPNLGVIIDLTNTNRYYDPNFFENEGVEHKKLMIPGHVTPPPSLVNRFKDLVKQFIQNNSDNDKLIGVHCTHGVNRTGYLICNYMVSEMSVDPPDAIKKFAEARGHKIERKNYVDSLHTLNSAEGEEDNTPQEKDEKQQRNLSHRKEDTKTNRIEHNWRTQRDQTRCSDSYSSISNWRNDNHNRSRTNYSNEDKYNWRSDMPNRERTRQYVDNHRGDQPNQSGPTPAKHMRTTTPSASAVYNRHNSYSNHKQERQYRDASNNSHHTNYNNKQYCPSNSETTSRSNRFNSSSSTSTADNKTKRRINTDYYNDSRTSSNRERISHYSKRQ